MHTKNIVKKTHKTYIVDATDSFRRVIINRDYSSSKCTVDYFVAGYKYYDGKDIIDFLVRNEPVNFVHEVFNAYDTFAIAIYTRDYVKLGYVPKVIAPLIAREIEKRGEDKPLRAYIKEINSRHSDYTKLEIRTILPIEVKANKI